MEWVWDRSLARKRFLLWLLRAALRRRDGPRLHLGAMAASLRPQQFEEVQMDTGRLPADAGRHAVETAQVRRAERQHDKRRRIVQLRLEARHQCELVGCGHMVR